MLSLSELLGVFLAQPAANCERRQLRVLCEPRFDRGNMRVELGRHANSGLIRPTVPSVRGTRLADRRGLAERLRERRRGRWQDASAGGLQAACLSGTTIDAIACCANRCQQRDRIERAILIAEPFLHGRGHLGIGQCTLIGRRWELIALDHFSAFATLLLQLERRMEEVDVELAAA